MKAPDSPLVASRSTPGHLLNTVGASLALGLMLSPLLYELAVATGLVEPFPNVRSSCGDTPQQYFTLYLGLAWGAGLGLALAATQWLRRRRWAAVLVFLDLTALYLALVLLQYGLFKVMNTQFPHMWANLDTPPGELTPMRVAWQFFGYSQAYQQFLGWGEMIPGLLLLFRRTRTFGALLATVVMLNVFLINIFFDVCVKIGSGSYLALALLLLLQDADRIWQFFIGHRPAVLRTLPPTTARFGRRGAITYRILGVLLTLVVVGMTIRDFSQIREEHQEVLAVRPYTGVWETERAERWAAGRWQPLTPTDSAYPARCYFQEGQSVIRNAFRRDRFIIEPDSARPQTYFQLILRNEQNDFLAPTHWQYTHPTPDSLHLLGRWHHDSLRLQLRLRRELMK